MARIGRLALAGAIFALTPFAGLAAPSDGDSLYGDVVRYSRMGNHRTGGAGDRATITWLAAEMNAAGFALEIRPFRFVRFEPRKILSRVAGREVAAVPAWLPATTAENGVVAPLRPFGKGGSVAGAIAYVDSATAGDWHEVDLHRWAAGAKAAGAVALIIAIDHPSGELYQQNASPPHVDASLPLPVLLVRSASAATLAMGLNRRAQVVLTGRFRRDATVANVLARLERDPSAPWIVVSTPVSAWFRSAGERGPGVALWLRMARSLAKREDGVNYLFIAASGHELDYAGARSLIGTPRLPDPRRVAFWFHLGASFGTREWREENGRPIPMPQISSGSSLFANRLQEAEIRTAFSQTTSISVRPIDAVPSSRGGELTLFRDAGYPVSGFVGSHRFFHTPRDLPDVTSPDLLAPYGSALERLLGRWSESVASRSRGTIARDSR